MQTDGYPTNELTKKTKSIVAEYRFFTFIIFSDHINLSTKSTLFFCIFIYTETFHYRTFRQLVVKRSYLEYDRTPGLYAWNPAVSAAPGESPRTYDDHWRLCQPQPSPVQ